MAVLSAISVLGTRWTTVRDIGGNSLGLAKYVRLGELTCPRIYSAGPAIAPPEGHTDIGGWNQHHAQELMTQWAEVSGRDEVIRQERWNIRRGAAFFERRKVGMGKGICPSPPANRAHWRDLTRSHHAGHMPQMVKYDARVAFEVYAYFCLILMRASLQVAPGASASTSPFSS